MIGRLILGFIKGALASAVFAAALVYGLKLTSWAAPLAFTMAVVAGIFTGLIAGKPIWQKGAKTEAILKAVVGAGLAAGAMYAARKWLTMPFDLGPLSEGSVPLGEIPVATVSLICLTIAIFYELDNTGGGPDGREPKRLEEKTTQ